MVSGGGVFGGAVAVRAAAAVAQPLFRSGFSDLVFSLGLLG